MPVNRPQGFTLIEVMVALMVVAVALSALMINTQSLADSSAYLNKKTIAQWVAMNQLELVRLQNARSNQLPSDTLTGSEQMAGRKWYWQVQPLKTANDGFMQLRITVFEDPQYSSQVGSLTGLVDRFHRRGQEP